MVQIGSGLSPEEFKAHSDLLKEFEDVFAWSHADMPGIDPEIVEHRIPLYPRHALLSFMDGFSGYNQILMAPEDREKTTFTIEWGTYCYRVMPFGMKNAGSTYQRAATTLLHDMIHKEVEVYVDDMIVKARKGKGIYPPSGNSSKGFTSTGCVSILRNVRLVSQLERCWNS
ncbi:hypothetical protein Vadar_018489 [Vaccinium darrowii]|uniref:Uncharacterized protein n=1 Tax=Vaccinium darrowii TaxID=229202 RepID=A0ACB7YML6_9ERIC|nr:hypothetical protein Vadar_018489 [Vaccinium darrowii]